MLWLIGQKIGQRSAVSEAAIAALKQGLARDNSLELRIVRSAGHALGPTQDPDGTHLIAAMEQAAINALRDAYASIVIGFAKQPKIKAAFFPEPGDDES